jgi:hypothetical protein
LNRVPEHGRSGAAPAGGQRRAGARDPVLALQRKIGNQAVRRLLQRDTTNASRLSKAAKQLRAGDLVKEVKAAGVEEGDIHAAARVKEGQDDGVRPGLNFVANLGARGRTGFVGADGKYLGDILPANIDEPLPRVAIMLGPLPFQEGDDGVRATLRHELEHAIHAELILELQRRWREALKKAGKSRPSSAQAAQADFFTFAERQKLSQVDLALIRGGTSGKTADTELLAHLEGFAAVFDSTPSPGPSVVLKQTTLPPAIEQLLGAGEHGWPGADEVVKTAAKDRLLKFYRGLSGDKQALLRDWLFFLHYRATTKWPKGAGDDEARAANLIFNVFHPVVGFLEWMLKLLGAVEYGTHKLPAPSNKEVVKVSARPAAAKTVKVAGGEVKVYLGVGYRFGEESKSHGVALSYEGSDAREMRWLQFIWREVVPDKGKAVAGKAYHQQQEYPLTTNPSEPSQIGWNTDTATYLGGAASAFYEVDNAVNRSDKKVEMFDEPSSSSDADVKAAFAAESDGGVAARAHLSEYLVQGPNVLFRADIEFEYHYDHASDRPDAKPKLVSAQPATALDPGARARLHAQFKDLDYLP